MLEFLNSYLTGQISSSQFKETFDGQTRKNWNCFGLISAWWHLQSTELWPVFYPRTRQALELDKDWVARFGLHQTTRIGMLSSQHSSTDRFLSDRFWYLIFVSSAKANREEGMRAERKKYKPRACVV
jgi:hypothetical protein